jgi:hypothetical protein
MLQSTADLGSDSFGPPQTFTGTQLLNGIAVQANSPTRFFRLINSSGP